MLNFFVTIITFLISFIVSDLVVIKIKTEALYVVANICLFGHDNMAIDVEEEIVGRVQFAD